MGPSLVSEHKPRLLNHCGLATRMHWQPSLQLKLKELLFETLGLSGFPTGPTEWYGPVSLSNGPDGWSDLLENNRSKSYNLPAPNGMEEYWMEATTDARTDPDEGLGVNPEGGDWDANMFKIYAED